MPAAAHHILWTGHAHDQSFVAALAQPEITAQFDGFAMVSESGRLNSPGITYHGSVAQPALAPAPRSATIWPIPTP